MTAKCTAVKTSQTLARDAGNLMGSPGAGVSSCREAAQTSTWLTEDQTAGTIPACGARAAGDRKTRAGVSQRWSAAAMESDRS